MRRTRYSCQILMKLVFPRQIFEKDSYIKFHENPSRGSRVVPCGQTDRHTDTTKLIVSFRNFANSLKIPRLFPAELQYFIVEKYRIYLSNSTSDIRSLHEDYCPISINATFYSVFYKCAYKKKLSILLRG